MKIIKEEEQSSIGGVKYMNRGPDIDWGLITLKPGEGKSAHYHEKMGETFYIIQGIMTFILEDKELDIKEGTALRMEENESHGLKNNSNTDAKMIFIKEKYLPKDKVVC